MIDGANKYRICSIEEGSTLTLDSGAIIQNGYSASEDTTGGIHMWNDTTLNMRPGSKILNNISETGSYHGGAIRMVGGCKVDIDGAEISDNSVRINGGAIYADRGATSLTIKNTTFSGNKASAGGAIYSAALTKIENCTFENNVSTGNGGAIYTNINATESNSLTISNTTFSANKAGSSGAQREGGAIYSMVNTKIEGGTFQKNSATREGGAIFTPFSTTITKNLLVNGAIFSENEAKDGGAIYSSAKMTISNALFQENNASADGGGIYAYRSEAVEIDNTTFRKNHALGTAPQGNRGNGGAIYAHKYAISLSITETNFSENTAKYGGGAVSSSAPTTIKGGKFELNSVGASGGAIVMDSDYTLEIENVILSENNAATNGGAICVDRAQSLSIKRTTFSNNSTTLQGGAIHSKVSTTIKGGKFELNSAKSGGAFHTASYVSLNISPFITADNTTENTSFSQNTAEYGGAIYSSANTTINQVTFQTNTASTEGGGIYASENAEVEIDGTTFQENKAQGNGGAIFAHKNAQSLSIKDTTENTTFAQNEADKSGGAIFSCVPTSIEGGRFEKNTAGMNGGAIFTQEDTTLKKETSFSENEALVEGGAIYTGSYSYTDPADPGKYANLIIDNTTSFENNKASYPYQPPSNYASFTDLLFSRTSFTNQQNPYSGEAILINNALLNNYDINYKNYVNNTLCPVTYTFEDTDSGSLPQKVLDLLPENSEVGIGSIVIPESPSADTVALANGTWEFEAWNKTQVNVPGDGIAFIGTWRWTDKEYTVNFETDGGTAVGSQTVIHGEMATKPADPTKDDHDFAGWYQETAAENVFDFTTPITAHTTVYAKWMIAPAEPAEPTTTPAEFYSITYIAEADVKDMPIDNNQYRSGSKVTILGPPTREGYKFLGWCINSLLQPGDVITVANADIVLTAEWQKVETGTTQERTFTSTTPTQTTTASNTQKAESLVKTGENLGQTFLFRSLSIFVAVILLFIRNRFKRRER